MCADQNLKKINLSDMIEQYDWSSTSLGPKDSWPISLRTVVDVILNSTMPMHLSWGKDLIQFYNVANSIIIGDQHPMIGKSFYKTWPEIHDKMLPLINKVLSGESLFFNDFVALIPRNNEETICHFSLSMSPVKDDQGIISGVLSTFIETTVEIQKQMLAEEQRQELYNLFMQAPMPIIILEGEEFKYVFTNSLYEKFLGKKTLGKTVLEVFSKEEIDHFLPSMMDVYHNGVSHFAREQPLNYFDEVGHFVKKWIDVGFYPLRDINGKIKGQFVIVTDITDAVTARKQAEKDLISRDEFISIASHEFKTPVSSLKLQFQMIDRNLKKGIPLAEESFKRMLNLSLRQIDGLARLIEDLLDATKASNQRMNFKFKETNISMVVNDAIHHVSQFLNDHETPLEVQVEENVGLYCDPFRIEQVVTNLLTNASKYGDFKPVSLSVKQTNQFVHIVVKDQGIGISKDNQDKIFSRFERGSVTKNYAGLGLGLFITKHIVNAHEGTIEIDSKPGAGSTFTVRLPKKLNKHHE